MTEKQPLQSPQHGQPVNVDTVFQLLGRILATRWKRQCEEAKQSSSAKNLKKIRNR